MKTVIQRAAFLGLLLLTVFSASAQDQKKAPASPPATATGRAGGSDIEINYSSPGVKGRTIWGELVPYDSVWRAGANQATTVTTSEDIQIKGESLPAGRYAFFVIPVKNGDWIVIFNRQTDQWGAFKYDETDDQLRVRVSPVPLDESVERLKYEVTEEGIRLSWDKIALPIPVE